MNSKPTQGAGALPPGGTQPGTTFLTGKQAAQILEKLKVIKNIEGQTIKIQTIQTNPQTGIKKIVAIPIQSASTSGGGQNLSVSPMKTLKTSDSPVLAQGRTLKLSSPRSTSFSSVSLVKSSASSVSLQQHPVQGEDAMRGVTKLVSSQSLMQSKSSLLSNSQATTTVPLNSNGSSSLLSSSKPTVMSQHRVTLTPQKSVSVGSSGASGLTAVGQIYPTTVARNHTLEPGEYVGTKRPLELDGLDMADVKRKKTEKGGKGLRHFSMKVCEKVKAKGTTSYNEVADELVAELTDPRYQSPSDPTYDQKNIRRRVYDALNVLMAMNIISKEKKEIRWLGLPTNSIQEVSSLESEKALRLERIKTKTKQLQDLILQHIAFKNLVERNRETESNYGSPTPNSAIQLPFIIVGTSKRTVIDCSISNDKMEYLFNFDNTFEIHDDMEVLKKMKMTMGLENGLISDADLQKAKSMVPRALQSYVEEMSKRGSRACDTLTPKVTQPIIKTETDPLAVFESVEEYIDEDSD